jgi:hypothetical protein
VLNLIINRRHKNIKFIYSSRVLDEFRIINHSVLCMNLHPKHYTICYLLPFFPERDIIWFRTETAEMSISTSSVCVLE